MWVFYVTPAHHITGTITLTPMLLNITPPYNRYNYIDTHVILGAIPFAFLKEKLVEEEKVGAIISLNMP